MLGCCGAAQVPGENAKRLAEIICAAVLAGELSLMASQCTDDLVRSHLKLNRYNIIYKHIKYANFEESTGCAEIFRPPFMSIIYQIKQLYVQNKKYSFKMTTIGLTTIQSGVDGGG